MTDLLPCPFCGGSAGTCQGPSPHRWGTQCRVCDVWRDDRCDTQDEAIAAWNARTPPQITDAMVEHAARAYRNAPIVSQAVGGGGSGRHVNSDAMRAALEAAMRALKPNPVDDSRGAAD